jgi:uncharacterized membrane protein
VSWIAYSTISALLFNFSVLIDEKLINGKLRNLSLTTMSAISGLAGAPFLLLFYILFKPRMDSSSLISGMIVGALVLFAMRMYYSALKISNPPLVTTLFSLVIPLNYVAGVFIFGEESSLLKTIGLAAVVVGSVLISVEEGSETGILKFNRKAFIYMLLSVFALAISASLFKNAANDSSFASIAFPEYLASVIFGILLLLSRSVRRDLSKLRGQFGSVIKITQLNEITSLGGTLAIRYAIVIGPLSLSQGVAEAQQPIFMVITAYLLAKFSHDKKYKKMSDGQFKLRISATCLSAFGILAMVV